MTDNILVTKTVTRNKFVTKSVIDKNKICILYLHIKYADIVCKCCESSSLQLKCSMRESLIHHIQLQTHIDRINFIYGSLNSLWLRRPYSVCQAYSDSIAWVVWVDERPSPAVPPSPRHRMWGSACAVREPDWLPTSTARQQGRSLSPLGSDSRSASLPCSFRFFLLRQLRRGFHRGLNPLQRLIKV